MSATLWIVGWLVIQEVRYGATEARIRQSLRIYLQNWRRAAGVATDRRESAQAYRLCEPLGFKDLDCPPTPHAPEMGLVVFDAIAPRYCGARASAFDLILPRCVWQVLPVSSLPEMRGKEQSERFIEPLAALAGGVTSCR